MCVIGYGGQTKPVFHKKAKTTKKVVLRLGSFIHPSSFSLLSHHMYDINFNANEFRMLGMQDESSSGTQAMQAL